MSKRVAVIDDDPIFLDLLREALGEEGYNVHVFAVDEESYDAHVFAVDEVIYPRLRDLDPAAIIVDLHAEHPWKGWSLLERLRRDIDMLGAAAPHAPTPVIVCAANPTDLRARAPYLAGPGYALLAKPFHLDDLLARLRQLTGAPNY